MSDFINSVASTPPLLFAVALFYGVAEVLCGAVLSYLILRQKMKKTIVGFIALFALCCAYSTATMMNNPLKDIAGAILMIAAPLLIYRFSLKRTLESIVIFIGTDMVMGLLATLISASLGSDYSQFDSAGKLTFNLFSSLIIILIFGVFIILDKRSSRKDSEFKSLSLPLYALIVFTASFFTVTMIYFQVNIEKSPAAFILCITNILLFAVTIFCAVRRFIKSQYAQQTFKKELDLQIRHFELMEKKNEELRIFRHDMPKKLRPLALYLESGNSADALEILKKLNVSIESSRPRFSTGNYRLDTVLESQQQLAEKVGAQIKMADGSFFPPEGIAPEDIYTIFPNALDNAIEACEKCSEDKRIILFESHPVHGRVFVKISNPYSESLHTVSDRLITTKSEKNIHGYGFRSIKKAAAKYGSDNVSFKAEDGVFTLMISLNPVQ